jgi:chromosome segregation ATPase
LKKQIEFNEINLEKLKADLNEKNKMEKNLIGDSENLNEKLFELSKNLGSKIDEINILNQKYKILQEKTVSDSFKMHTLEEDINFHKAQISSLNKDIDAKNIEIRKLEASLKSQETDLKRIDSKFTTVDKTVRSKFEEVNNGRQALFELQNKFDKLTDDTDAKVNTMSREIERLSGEKTKLKQAFDNLNIIHEKCIAGRGEQSEKVVMKKLESQVLTAKYESKVQYLEIEIDTLRSKVRKLLKEKEVHDHINKENQLLVKEIAHKYQTDSDNWNRQRQKLLEKEKLYEESVDMRKELKKAADKLRQKLQSLEDQIIDKQNKHTIEKNSWETQRMQYVSAINRLEEQHGKSSTLKKFSKKEAEIVWEKERTELSTHVVNLEAFIKDLQSQLCQRNQNTNQTMTNDQYTQNEKIQSLFGENEFLKNRIREV